MRAEMGKDPTRAPPSQLNLPPGFRFYPTDEELVIHYLCKQAACEPFAVPVIAEVELYKFDPWDLPERALFGEKEWYFFSPRDRKYPNGSRPNRAAGTGYWKATGTDKPISTMSGSSKKVGVKKALVFYRGKAPKGVKTNWIMHEYRLADGAGVARSSTKRKGSFRLDDWVLCRIYKKSSSATSVQVKGTAVAGIKAEQSESSCLDDVLASLSDQLDNQIEDQIEDAHTALVGADHSQSEAASFYSGHGKSSSDLRAFMRQLQEKTGMVDQFNVQEGSEMARARPDQLLNRESSNLSSIAHSPLEYSTTSKEEEDMAVESTFNSLAGLPLTQLLSTSNLSYSANSFYGLDLGLPSPCSILASGAPSYGGSLIDPDNGFFQPSQLGGWESSSINRINFPS